MRRSTLTDLLGRGGSGTLSMMRRLHIVAIAGGVLCGCGGSDEELGRNSQPSDATASESDDATSDETSGDVLSGDGVSSEADADNDAATGDTLASASWPITRCNNGKDDDGDGLVDYLDPECTTPYDDDEASFAKGIPGDGEDGSSDPCKFDCAFDGNSGSGDDGCVFSGKCISGSTYYACPYDPVAAKDPTKCPPQSAKCVDKCGALTPNGCDYLGCCDVFDSSGKRHRVRLHSPCTFATLSDPTKCVPCEQIVEYTKPCDRCDVCLGKWSLPSDCEAQCAGGTRCGAGLPCPAGQWCLTGCCIAPPSP